MGYIAHHAIIVTGADYNNAIVKAHAKAKELGCCVTSLTAKAVNGYRSFLIAPDGSKEGWQESDAGDQRRAEWIEWTKTTLHEDGSGPLEWVEVRFGSDDNKAEVSDHAWSDENRERTET